MYMLDGTSSMARLKVGPDTLWNAVRNSLEKVILEVDDTSTLVVVAPFWENVLDVWNTKSTASGKREIIRKIRNFKVGGRNTNISAALEKGYSLMDPNYVNYLFLMTDGEHNTQTKFAHREIIGNGKTQAVILKGMVFM